MSARFLNGVDLNNQRITAVASPSAPTDGVNKAYVDGLVNGLAWKQPVRAATTTAGTLASSFANGSVIDGVTLATGDRILVQNQTNGAENGIYAVAASGAPTRTADASTTAQLNNATVYVMSGTVDADKAFTQTADNPTVGTTALVWVQVGGGAGTTYSAGTGILITGSTIALDTTVAVRKYATNSVAASAGATTTYTHNLGTTDVDVTVIEVSTGQQVQPDWAASGVNTVTVTSGTAVTVGQYRIVVNG